MPGVVIQISEIKGETKMIGTQGTPTLYCSAKANFTLQSIVKQQADVNVVVHVKIVNNTDGKVIYDKDVITETLRVTKGRWLEQERIYVVDTGIYNTQTHPVSLSITYTITASYAPLFGIVLKFPSSDTKVASFTLPPKTTSTPPNYTNQSVGTTVTCGCIGLVITKIADQQWQVKDVSGPSPKTTTKYEYLPLPPTGASNVELAAWLDRQFGLPSPTIKTTDVKTILWLSPEERETFMKEHGYVAQVVGSVGVKPPTTPIPI